MVIFEPWLFPPQPKLDAVRASVLSRDRYERLVVAERPWWERLLAPVAARLGSAMPALASQVSERDIIRAGSIPGRSRRPRSTPRSWFSAWRSLASARL
jgi:hypothetical protein